MLTRQNERDFETINKFIGIAWDVLSTYGDRAEILENNRLMDDCYAALLRFSDQLAASEKGETV